MAFPNFDSEFKLYTDASQSAVGSVLAQVQDDKERVIAYASSTLTQSQQRWSTFDRELWAIVCSIRHFKHYLCSNHFLIITDHKPLKGLRTLSLENDGTGRRARWMTELDPLDWEIIYKEGKKHLNADALSRLPELRQDDVKQHESKVADPMKAIGSECQSIELNSIFSVGVDPYECSEQLFTMPNLSMQNDICSDISTQDVLWHQRQDLDIFTVFEWCELGEKPPFSEVKYGSPCLRKLWHAFDDLEIHNGLLCKRVEDKLQVVIPGALIPEVLKQLHGSPLCGHFSVRRTCARAEQSCYWPYMIRDIQEYCKKCIACEAKRQPNPPFRAPLQPMVTSKPFERVAADITELPCSSSGNRYVLVVTDYFTKYINLYAMPNQTAETVAQCLFDNYFL